MPAHAGHDFEAASLQSRIGGFVDRGDVGRDAVDFPVRAVDEREAPADAPYVVDERPRILQVFDHMAADDEIPRTVGERERIADHVIDPGKLALHPTPADGRVVDRVDLQPRPDDMVGMQGGEDIRAHARTGTDVDQFEDVLSLVMAEHRRLDPRDQIHDELGRLSSPPIFERGHVLLVARVGREGELLQGGDRRMPLRTEGRELGFAQFRVFRQGLAQSPGRLEQCVLRVLAHSHWNRGKDGQYKVDPRPGRRPERRLPFEAALRTDGSRNTSPAL